MTQEHLDRAWKEKPEFVRRYYEILPCYERLCSEIENTLRAEINNIEIAQITSRTKKLPSFCEKIFRKSHEDPFSEIADMSGVRVVYLYMSDLTKIQKIIEMQFDVVEMEDKLESQEVEKFGYGALHYIVKLKKHHTGARYDDLKDLVCEIQVRTILQDAWAVVAHHLSYKHEDDVPKTLRRKLHALSGLFETADDQFEGLRLAIGNYTDEIESNILNSTEDTFEENLNLDNLVAYMSTKFKNRTLSSREDSSELLSELKRYGYNTLSDVAKIVDRAFEAVLEDENSHPPMDSGGCTTYSTVGLVRSALSFIDVEYCLDKYSEETLKNHEKFQHLVKCNA